MRFAMRYPELRSFAVTNSAAAKANREYLALFLAYLSVRRQSVLRQRW